MRSESRIIQGDCLEVLRGMDSESVHCCITSPPYWGLRDYGEDGQVGLEKTPEEYVERMVEIFREVGRVLRDDGTLWLNLGDSYHSGNRGGYRNDSHRWENSPMQPTAKGTHMEKVAPNRLPQKGLKDKDLVGIPWRVAFALQADGWYLRSDIIWSKNNPMPESVRDRPTKSHEYIFLMSKSQRYYYDAESIREKAAYEGDTRHLRKDVSKEYGGPREDNFSQLKTGNPTNGRNKRSVWTVATQPYAEAHFAVFPEKLIVDCVLAGCPKGGTILDPFCGAGTTGVVALKQDRNFIGIELNGDYCEMARKRISKTGDTMEQKHWMIMKEPHVIRRAKNRCESCGISNEERQHFTGERIFLKAILFEDNDSKSLDNLVALCQKCERNHEKDRKNLIARRAKAKRTRRKLMENGQMGIPGL